jgi:hypothetical protein
MNPPWTPLLVAPQPNLLLNSHHYKKDDDDDDDYKSSKLAQPKCTTPTTNG